METIILILGIACLVILAINHDVYQVLSPKFKPFTCALCMGFWVSVLPLIFIYGWYGIPYAALAAVITEFIDREINKY